MLVVEGFIIGLRMGEPLQTGAAEEVASVDKIIIYRFLNIIMV